MTAGTTFLTSAPAQTTRRRQVGRLARAASRKRLLAAASRGDLGQSRSAGARRGGAHRQGGEGLAATASSVADSSGSTRRARDARPEPAPVWLAVAGAALAGAALVVAFPPVGVWLAAPVGVALLAAAAHRRRARAGAGLGLLAGMVFFAPLLQWTALDDRIGQWPWVLLALSQAAFVALLGAAAAWCSPVVDRWRWSWAPLTGVLWLADEALRSRLPFGGFPWGRLAFSQADSPLVWLAALGGAPLTTFGTAVVGGFLAAAAWTAAEGLRGRPQRINDGPGRPAWTRGLALLAAAVLALLSGFAVPYQPPAGDAVTVAIIQGNVPRIGLDFNAQRRAVLDNHVDGTLRLARQVARGEARQPDLVIWPENSSDIDPLVNDDARARIDEAANTIGVPILVGAVLVGPGDHVRNAGLVWLPGEGPVDSYVKQHPVPFAEYMPMRPLVRMITEKADLAGNFASGDEPGVLRVGPATVGDVICFEVAYDDLVRDTIIGGAQLIVVQTNNATFNDAEAQQQMAMVRLRAIEHGRPALMASTVGVSGFAGADGAVLDASRFNTPATAVRTVRLGDGGTLATRLGALPEIALGLAALAALAGRLALRWRVTAARLRRRDDDGDGERT
ncbi:MAG: apolipoprotein N-acyltransferase [Micromonosporaceae bacterium]|nr:apolipoprotein N-acyltransferase [Micromonosporaceae bacterium]